MNANIRTSKYLAAITVGFFVAISPWTLCTLVIVAANIKLNQHVDYTVTWLALSNSFMNCLIYGVMNRKFRRAAVRFVIGTFVKSIQDKFASSKSGDESKDFTDETSAYARYKKRSSQKKGKKQQVNGLEVNESVDISTADNSTNDSRTTPRVTPRHTPRGTPTLSRATPL